MRNDFESNYLAHHGILGMHWGKRNGPPYPLDAADHSSSEKKAGWRKSLGSAASKVAGNVKKQAKKQIQIKNEVSIHKWKMQYDPIYRAKHDPYGNFELRRKTRQPFDEKSQSQRENEEAKARLNKKGLTDSQKKAIKIGLGVAGAAAITVGSAYAAKHLNKKIIAGLTKESIDRGYKFADEYIKLHEQSTKAFTLASQAARDGRKKDADRLNTIADKLIKASGEYAKKSQAERDLRSKAFSNKDKIDYIKRYIKKSGSTPSDGIGLNSETFKALLSNEETVERLRRAGYPIEEIRKIFK